MEIAEHGELFWGYFFRQIELRKGWLFSKWVDTGEIWAHTVDKDFYVVEI